MIPFYKSKKSFPCPKYFGRNDYLRFIYCSLFSEFSFDELKEFWSAHKITLDNNELSLRETIEHIWNVDKLSPFEYVFSVLNSLEPFFVRKKKDFKGFLFKNISKDKFGRAVIPRLAIWSIEPILFGFFHSTGDFRTLLLKYLDVINDRIRPGTWQKLIKLELHENRFKGLVAFAPDPFFQRDFSWIDGELFFAITLQYGPTRFGISEHYESYEIKSECQSAIKRVQNEANVNIQNSTFIINGKVYGKELIFSEFLSKHHIPLEKNISFPDKTVVEITKNYYCPIRKRIILHRGCAYGAPISMYVMIYPKRQKRKYSLSKLLAEVFKNTDASRKSVEESHKKFIQLLDTSLVFRYNSESGYIFLNNKFVTRGVQAKILRKMAKTAFEEKRFEFEHKEFVGAREFITDPQNTGFVTRLHRIKTRLDKLSPFISLEKTEKGKITLKSSLPIQYTED